MAKRVVDCKSIYSEDWDAPTRDVFFWLIGVGADGFGMQREKPELVSAATGWPVSRVRAAIEWLVSDGTLLRYTVGNGSYLVFAKWQDYQRVKYPGRPTCPWPPPEIFGKLSEETQKFFGKFSGKFPPSVAVAVAIATEVPGSGDKSPSPSTSAEAVAGNAVHQAVRHFYERYQQRSGLERPPFPGGRAAGFIARRLREGDDPADLPRATDFYFDHWLPPKHTARGLKRTGSWQDFERNYAAIWAAIHEQEGGDAKVDRKRHGTG